MNINFEILIKGAEKMISLSYTCDLSLNSFFF